jgi:thiol-disulfide isomerase/thioredoxin
MSLRGGRLIAGALLAASLSLAASVSPAQEGEPKPLTLGDPAPALAVSKFVKGEPVARLEPGKVYVVEFWATWCGPCRETIPHLTALQKEHKDAVIIGVDAFEQDVKQVEPFLKEMGDKMDYRVALDDVAEGDEPSEGKMAKTWMDAAGEGGIPTAFIVNQEGKVAWIGHPTSLEKPLKEVLEGKYDLAAAAAERKKGKERESRFIAVQEKLQETGRDPARMLAVLDEAIEKDPELEQNLGLLKFNLLAAQKDQEDRAIAYGRKLMNSAAGASSNAMNNLAWILIDPERGEKPSKAAIVFAVEAAKKGDDLAEKKDPAVADTYGWALFLSGDAKAALEVQTRAMKLAEGSPLAEDEGMTGRLETYRKAVEGK